MVGAGDCKRVGFFSEYQNFDRLTKKMKDI